jgi:hypothetical protein
MLARGLASNGKSRLVFMNLRCIVVIGVVLAIGALPAMAVENAVGRTLPGMWVQPQAGVVPEGPGSNFSLVPFGYLGTIGGSRLAPIAGVLTTNISADINENLLVPQYVYKTEHPKIRLSSTFYTPVNYQNGTGSLQIGDTFSRSTTFISRGLSDVFFSPLTVGIHFSENNNLAIDTKIWAPSGAYERGNLANLGMNVWTFTPNLAHTYLWKKRGLEVDNYVALDIYTQNPVTKYTSGTVFHWDGMLFQYLSERGGFGAIVSNITQLNRDRGPLAGRLNGFQGGGWGAGPLVMYVAKVQNPGMILAFRWVPEFHVQNLLKGNTFMLGLTLKL